MYDRRCRFKTNRKKHDPWAGSRIRGRNIYEIFNQNIAYEIRLQQAMEEDLLCPFHYFGITDHHMISDEGKTKEEQLENFRYLTSDERVKYVMDQAK